MFIPSTARVANRGRGGIARRLERPEFTGFRRIDLRRVNRDHPETESREEQARVPETLDREAHRRRPPGRHHDGRPCPSQGYAWRIRGAFVARPSRLRNPSRPGSAQLGINLLVVPQPEPAT